MTCMKCPRRSKARGLCGPCWAKAKRNGTLCDYERQNRSADDVIADCQAMAGETAETIAARLDYASRNSLYQILYRSGHGDIWGRLTRGGTA